MCVYIYITQLSTYLSIYLLFDMDEWIALQKL